MIVIRAGITKGLDGIGDDSCISLAPVDLGKGDFASRELQSYSSQIQLKAWTQSAEQLLRHADRPVHVPCTRDSYISNAQL